MDLCTLTSNHFKLNARTVRIDCAHTHTRTHAGGHLWTRTHLTLTHHFAVRHSRYACILFYSILFIFSVFLFAQYLHFFLWCTGIRPHSERWLQLCAIAPISRRLTSVNVRINRTYFAFQIHKYAFFCYWADEHWVWPSKKYECIFIRAQCTCVSVFTCVVHMVYMSNVTCATRHLSQR